ncbi:MAG: hypothetical protein P0Y55_15830 [Candidatus Cohnella colombiensis]|uniref:Dihydroorotate dehydrogenase catalytic domain-containing protein n=1 Tax=Candidatus Cohnella colombiensis TaxID=3121368 RepID=A0AA95EY07_9BACL|nr:MAG: hypothetical protein P0Y55_15830 [Cohnella sp.]
MPDWSYQTLFRPVLFRLPARVARTVTLNAMRGVSRIPGGTFIIKTLGHMEPSPLLESHHSAIIFSTPVGLSGGVDPHGTAHRALSQFGFGFVELGPITKEQQITTDPIRMDLTNEALLYPSEYENDGLQRFIHRIRNPGHRLPLFARIAADQAHSVDHAAEELRSLHHTLSHENLAGIYVEAISEKHDLTSNKELLQQMTELALQVRTTDHDHARQLLYLYIPLDFPNDELKQLLQDVDTSQWDGFVIGNAIHEQDRIRIGKEGLALCIDKLQLLREMTAPSAIIKATAGVHEPQDALDLLHAGADYILLHSGLVFSGPGLPKRINDAIIYNKISQTPPPPEPSFWKHWGWLSLLGIGMIIGGMIAWLIASSSVLLSYDEVFLGMTRTEVGWINPHLLHFMSHDRITLAGTMMSLGILYYYLAKNGIRHGLHWAKTAVMCSGIIGFSSFFLYLGYGYFDPIHAVAAAILFPMFILAMRSNPDQPLRSPVNLHNSREWRLAMWGQLCFVILGFALCIGGIVIAGVGVTNVFVPQDLTFMGLTREALNNANPNLIPLIAHDRAGFGGALLSDAVLILIVALWGLQQGQRWQWWTLLLGGAPGFVAGLSVHYGIGYMDFIHLLPAYFALALYITGLILLYPYSMSEVRSAKR